MARDAAPIDVFIVYARGDGMPVQALSAALRERGLTPFSDHNLRLGDVWDEVLPAKLVEARAVAVVISPRWPKIGERGETWYGPEEVAIAIQRAREARPAPRLIPIWLDGAADRTPYGLRRVVGVDVADHAFDVAANGIAAVLADPGEARPAVAAVTTAEKLLARRRGRPCSGSRSYRRWPASRCSSARRSGSCSPTRAGRPRVRSCWPAGCCCSSWASSCDTRGSSSGRGSSRSSCWRLSSARRSAWAPPASTSWSYRHQSKSRPHPSAAARVGVRRRTIARAPKLRSARVATADRRLHRSGGAPPSRRVQRARVKPPLRTPRGLLQAMTRLVTAVQSQLPARYQGCPASRPRGGALTPPPTCAPGAFALRVDSPLLGLKLGEPIVVHSTRPGPGSPVEAVPNLALGLDACDGAAEPRVVGDGSGRYTLRARALPDGAQRACIVAFCGGDRVFDPPSIGFCPGDVPLQRCHPAWFEAECMENGRSIDRRICHLRARAANKMAGDMARSLYWKPPDARARPIDGSYGASCPTVHPAHGLVFAQDGQLSRISPPTPAMADGDALLAPEPLVADPELLLTSPWATAGGWLVAVGQEADGHRWLLRLRQAPRAAGTLERVRRLPAAAGRITFEHGGVVLMTSRDGPTGIDVPLDPARPILAGQRPPPERCSTDIGEHMFFRL